MATVTAPNGVSHTFNNGDTADDVRKWFCVYPNGIIRDGSGNPVTGVLVAVNYRLDIVDMPAGGRYNYFPPYNSSASFNHQPGPVIDIDVGFQTIASWFSSFILGFKRCFGVAKDYAHHYLWFAVDNRSGPINHSQMPKITFSHIMVLAALTSIN